MEQNLAISAGLFVILLFVLLLPFRVKKIEENLEPFFLVMGILSIIVSYSYLVEHLEAKGLGMEAIAIEALEAPIKIAEIFGIPIGIFQVVLIVGLVIHYWNKPIYSSLLWLLKKIGVRFFLFFFIVFFGLVSSIISVILSAVLIAEIALVTPLERRKRIEFVVVACFAAGLGAALTPIGEPLSTIAVKKLSGEPYQAGFFFLFDLLAIYIIPAVIALGIYGAFRAGKIGCEEIGVPTYEGTLRDVFVRAIKVYTFIAALVLLGNGFMPIIDWYISKIPAQALYWVNMVSAILDNATLTAAEIGPHLNILQIKSALIGLLISGGMLIPGNIPNIVSAARLKITMSEWARIGVPIGLVLMVIYFVILFFI